MDTNFMNIAQIEPLKYYALSVPDKIYGSKTLAERYH